MGMLKPWHIIVLVIVILLLFGARRLPDLARSVGQSLKIFKSEVKDLTNDDKPDQPASGGTTSSAGTVPPATSGTTNPASPPSSGGVTPPDAEGPKA
ncbi:Sec-independent protein translocase subunit TatA [Isoptericola sp. NEAU-Y5]|uniref:Sec-independent protein translocase protein TatA n=1 Tax=Isoptericola luteus TaxID=2879484 RepID=A0ABS7ZIA0_9MICO|nr:Sec-independent protein translocase subunit TatA [Isoptericola sp. NEAU-Y5]MCA5894749.1 Sec-independent protein translocase subunit TatA [Isoptericola sp. NEAU-Y5]